MSVAVFVCGLGATALETCGQVINSDDSRTDACGHCGERIGDGEDRAAYARWCGYCGRDTYSEGRDAVR